MRLRTREGNLVFIYMTETYGAVNRALGATLTHLGKCSRAPGTTDSTVYGQSRGSPRTFYAHHLAAIAASVVCADADTLLTHAVTLSLALASGASI